MPSSVLPWLTIPQPRWASEAERVGGHPANRMQNINPALLSTTIFQGAIICNEGDAAYRRQDRFSWTVKDRYKGHRLRRSRTWPFSPPAPTLRSAGRQGAAVPDMLIEFGRDTLWQPPVLDYAIPVCRTGEKGLPGIFHGI